MCLGVRLVAGASSSNDVDLSRTGRSLPVVAARVLTTPSTVFTSGSSAFFIPHGAAGGL